MHADNNEGEISMTKAQLFSKYKIWAERNKLYYAISDLDDAPQVYSFNSGRTKNTFSGTSVHTIATHDKNKLHMFIFTMRCTWSEDPKNPADEEEVDVDYKLVIAF